LLVTLIELWCVSPSRYAAKTVEVLPGSALTAGSAVSADSGG